VERSPVSGFVGAWHWAVKVGDDDFYEIERQGSKKDKRNSINGKKDGKPKSYYYNRSREATLLLAGATEKSDSEIIDFNREWVREFPTYAAVADNCQKFTLDLVQHLIGGAFELPLPQAGVGAWSDGPGSSTVDSERYAHAKATTGKAGAQYGILGVEAEGPKVAAGVSNDIRNGNWGAYTEASLGRAEGKVGPVRARLEPNLNTGAGFRDGQAQAKFLGFGFSVGNKGAGLSTPLGSFGFGSH